MRILVNAASANMGGATTYLTNTTRWMAELGSEHHITVVAPEQSANALRADTLRNVSVISYPYSDTGGWKRLFFDQIAVRSLIRREEIDVLFSTTGFGTWLSPVPQVLLVRNLAYFDPAFHSLYRRLKRSLRRNTIRRWLSILSIRRADYILFPTEGMRDIVASWVSLDPHTSEALHYGFEKDAIERSDDHAPGWLKKLRALKSQGYRILVNVSTYSVQKNLETAVAALPTVAERFEKVKFVTTTSRDRTTDIKEYDALRRMANDNGADEHWIELGYVPYHQLGALYDLADVSLFPSITESFGHSMVESMAFGLPVVAADTPVNREVCGPGGTYFDPADPTDCADRVVHVLKNHETRKELARAALARSEEFSWRKYSARLLDIMMYVTSRTRRPE